MTNEPRVDTTRLQRFARAYAESAVFWAAIDLDLFTEIHRGHDTFETAAAAMGISELNAHRLITCALTMGMLTLDDDKLSNAPDVDRYLVSDSDRYAGAWMQFTRRDVDDWMKLTELLRSPEPPKPLGMYEDLTVERARKYHQATYSVGMGAARRFCRSVDLSGRSKLLDLGGGSGAYSITAVQTFEGLDAVVFDLPPVTVVCQEYLEKNGVTDRVTTHGGDFTSDAFPTDCDAAVMASNIPIYSHETIAAVIARAHDALLPGAEFHLVGEMVDDDRTGPMDPALWGMQEIIYGSGGQAHTVGECRGYLEAAGFGTITDNVFIAGTLHRVSGLKA